MPQVRLTTIWRGKRVDSMTREELIDLVEELGRMYQDSAKDYAEAIDRLLVYLPKTRKRPRAG